MIGDLKELLVKSKFGHLWLSQIISQLILNLLTFLLMIRLFAVTESTIATSFLWIAYAIPALFVGPFSAVLVDMWDRRKILMITNFAQALTLLVFAIFYKKYLFLSYGVIAVYSLFDQFYVPAEAASLPSLVKKNDLAQANGMFFITQQASLVGGFGIAGFLNELLGFQVTLFVCTFFMLIAFVSVYLLPKMPSSAKKTYDDFEGSLIGFFKRISEGYRFIRGRHDILIPFIMLMGLQVVVAMMVVIVPVLAKEVIFVSPNASGVLVVVPAALGAGLGSIVVARLLKRGVRKLRIIETSLNATTCSILLLSILVPLLPHVLRLFVAIICFFLVGISGIGLMIPSQTYLQEATPGGMRGRLFGNFWFLTTAATVPPILFTATLVDLLGVKMLLLCLSLTLVGGMFIAKKYGKQFVYANLGNGK